MRNGSGSMVPFEKSGPAFQPVPWLQVVTGSVVQTMRVDGSDDQYAFDAPERASAVPMPSPPMTWLNVVGLPIATLRSRKRVPLSCKPPKTTFSSPAVGSPDEMP